MKSFPQVSLDKKISQVKKVMTATTKVRIDFKMNTVYSGNILPKSRVSHSGMLTYYAA